MSAPAPANVFVLGTGRCGTTTFIEACRHVANRTAAHESRISEAGPGRLAYPLGHVEADNRLSWMLGRLAEDWGDRALYVHMLRDEAAVARSYLARWKIDESIIYGWRTSIVPGIRPGTPPLEVALDYARTVNANIRAFLLSRAHVATVRLERAEEDFGRVWDQAGFEGDRAAALAEWRVPHNAARPPREGAAARLRRLPAKLGRVARKLPDFLDRA